MNMKPTPGAAPGSQFSAEVSYFIASLFVWPPILINWIRKTHTKVSRSDFAEMEQKHNFSFCFMTCNSVARMRRACTSEGLLLLGCIFPGFYWEPFFAIFFANLEQPGVMGL